MAACDQPQLYNNLCAPAAACAKLKDPPPFSFVFSPARDEATLGQHSMPVGSRGHRKAMRARRVAELQRRLTHPMSALSW
jgi:hypothetical protein